MQQNPKIRDIYLWNFHYITYPPTQSPFRYPSPGVHFNRMNLLTNKAKKIQLVSLQTLNSFNIISLLVFRLITKLVNKNAIKTQNTHPWSIHIMNEPPTQSFWKNIRNPPPWTSVHCCYGVSSPNKMKCFVVKS